MSEELERAVKISVDIQRVVTAGGNGRVGNKLEVMQALNDLLGYTALTFQCRGYLLKIVDSWLDRGIMIDRMMQVLRIQGSDSNIFDPAKTEETETDFLQRAWDSTNERTETTLLNKIANWTINYHHCYKNLQFREQLSQVHGWIKQQLGA